MRERVAAVLDEVKEDLAATGFDDAFVHRSVARLQALAIETESDRRAWLEGFVQLARWLEQRAPAASKAAYRQQREQVAAAFDGLFGDADTPYLLANRIVERAAERLKADEDADTVVADAVAELRRVASDALVHGGALLRVRSLARARAWLREPPRDDPVDQMLVDLVQRMSADAEAQRLDVARVLRYTDTIRVPPDASAAMREVIAGMLATLYGWVLLLSTEVSPGLEPLRDRIVALLEAPADGQAEAQSAAAPATEPPPPAASAAGSQCDAILAELARCLERGEFSEYLLREAMTALQAVSSEHPGEGDVVHAALVRMLDLAAPHAPADVAESLRITRDGLLAQVAPADGSDLADAAAVSRAADAIVDALREALARGEPVTPAATRALMALQALGQRLGAVCGDADDVDTARMQAYFAGMTRYLAALQDQVPQAQQAQFLEVQATAEQVLAQAGTLLGTDDAATQAQAVEQTQEGMERLALSADLHEIAPQLRELPHVLQLLQLVPAFGRRLFLASLRLDPASADHAESMRLTRRADESLKLMGAATVEPQFMRPQRSGLRRAAVELRQFERRRQLMLARPIWPGGSVMIDANAVFFAGGPEVAALLDQACDTLGMSRPEPQNSDSLAQARWQLLRRCALAVFDFTAFDPQRADSGARLPRSATSEASVLRAAAPTARAAYECGWAFVTGTPTLIVAREGQPVPFDIDIEPVRLRGDGGDAARLVAALQSALYGVQRTDAGDALAATVDQALMLPGVAADPALRALLDPGARDVSDAMRVQRALAAVLGRLGSAAPIVVRPALAPRYPRPDEARLFHVTAFRDWSVPVQQALRALCGRRGIEYAVGYERMAPDVLGAIWDDLCLAHRVVADITNLNPNAVLELGIAHALGRPTLAICCNAGLPGQLHALVPALRGLRLHACDPAAGLEPLDRLAERFIDVQE